MQSSKTFFQDAIQTEEYQREKRSAIRQCTYNSLNDEKDIGEITVGLALFIWVGNSFCPM